MNIIDFIDRQVNTSPRPTMIILANCGITDDSVDQIVSYLNQFPFIRSLNLRHNNIFDPGAIKLTKLRYVKKLNLRHTHLGFPGIVALCQQSQFTELDLSDNALNLTDGKRLVREVKQFGLDLTDIKDLSVSCLQQISCQLKHNQKIKLGTFFQF